MKIKLGILIFYLFAWYIPISTMQSDHAVELKNLSLKNNDTGKINAPAFEHYFHFMKALLEREVKITQQISNGEWFVTYSRYYQNNEIADVFETEFPCILPSETYTHAFTELCGKFKKYHSYLVAAFAHEQLLNLEKWQYATLMKLYLLKYNEDIPDTFEVLQKINQSKLLTGLSHAKHDFESIEEACKKNDTKVAEQNYQESKKKIVENRSNLLEAFSKCDAAQLQDALQKPLYFADLLEK